MADVLLPIDFSEPSCVDDDTTPANAHVMREESPAMLTEKFYFMPHN